MKDPGERRAEQVQRNCTRQAWIFCPGDIPDKKRIVEKRQIVFHLPLSPPQGWMTDRIYNLWSASGKGKEI
jgi:hypothetical protein